MDIRLAVESEAPVLSALAMRAKSHWGYSTETLERWRSELAISPTDVRERPTFVAMVGAEVAGFYSLRPSSSSWELDNLWVLPEFMHQGIGHALLSHALATAAGGGASEVIVDADPNAESFYLQCGAVRRGETPAPISGDPKRVRPQLAFVQPDEEFKADELHAHALAHRRSMSR
jgi:N-acetylglutamate synthase-like GNAT family acetyltransferase